MVECDIIEYISEEDICEMNQKARQDETVSTFLEKLEHLPELSKEELEELSERVKKFNLKK